MLKKYMKGSNIIELVEETENEDRTAYKAILRVVGDNASWSTLMVDILRAPDEDSEFICSIRKEYYISEENSPTFCWVLAMWGHLDDAFDEVGPVIKVRRQTSPKKAPSPAPEPTVQNKGKVTRKVSRSNDGVRVVSSIPLPFKRGSRDDPGKTKTLNDRKGVGAYVENMSGGI
jgi:hypothetical protein